MHELPLDGFEAESIPPPGRGSSLEPDSPGRGGGSARKGTKGTHPPTGKQLPAGGTRPRRPSSPSPTSWTPLICRADATLFPCTAGGLLKVRNVVMFFPHCIFCEGEYGGPINEGKHAKKLIVLSNITTRIYPFKNI